MIAVPVTADETYIADRTRHETTLIRAGIEPVMAFQIASATAREKVSRQERANDQRSQ